MEVLAAGHLPLRLPWSGDTHQSNARPTLRAALRPLCGVLCNVSSSRDASFREGRNVSMPARASGGDGGSGGPRAFPPTGGLPSPVLFAARRLFDQAYLKHLQRGSNLSEAFPDRSLSCQRRHISSQCKMQRRMAARGIPGASFHFSWESCMPAHVCLLLEPCSRRKRSPRPLMNSRAAL